MAFIENAITDLISSLSTGELVSLMFIVGGAGYYGLKWYAHVKTFVKETAQEEIKKEGKKIDDDKLKEQIDELQIDLNKLISNTNELMSSTEIASIDNKIVEFKNMLDARLIALNDQMVDIYKDVHNRIDKADDMHKEIINNINILKMAIDRLEMTIKDMSPENKTLHQETLRQVQAVSKDLATLQGTIIGNMSGSRTTLR